MSKRLDFIEQIIEKGSLDPFVWYGRAMELRSLGRLPEALAAYDATRERFPDYVPVYLMAAQVAEESGRRSDAKRWLEQGLEVARRKGDDHAAQEMQTLHDSFGSSNSSDSSPPTTAPPTTAPPTTAPPTTAPPTTAPPTTAPPTTAPPTTAPPDGEHA